MYVQYMLGGTTCVPIEECVCRFSNGTDVPPGYTQRDHCTLWLVAFLECHIAGLCNLVPIQRHCMCKTRYRPTNNLEKGWSSAPT